MPVTDARYWSALFVASLLGTIFGDFVSTTMNLGFTAGFLSLSFLFLIVIFGERRSMRANELYYWMAIVLTRTAATDLADLATHGLRLNYIGVAACLGALFLAILLVGRSWHLKATRLPGNSLPTVDARYWAAILVASTIGTTMGDFVSTGLNLGFRNSSLLLGTLLAIVFFAKSRTKSNNEAYYWITILILRTAGTTIGDFISSDEGLNLGFAGGAAAMAGLLLAVLYLFPRRAVVGVS